ncbi:hypothetical protein QTO34_015133 [Cnephaeus nilssonii]|uniref:HAT C-terminal dimerisation domain-containing protein n=1 Tax=Cnephaeus nilssonii TaxID=3371016 RepID=A0AA40I3J5_CNENI|nr:hypothetical protein QTO34_015133 [Eptesicus nilssonii]
MKIIKYPDVGVYSSLELNGFQWMQIDDLDMQLAEFQDSIWAQVFVDLRSKLENLERCRLENQEECHYEQEIWSAWNRLPDTFSTLKNIAMALLTIFPSTYFCEALFSALNNIKTNKRNRLTDEVSSACLGLKCTKYQPSIEDLANEIQQQKSPVTPNCPPLPALLHGRCWTREQLFRGGSAAQLTYGRQTPGSWLASAAAAV